MAAYIPIFDPSLLGQPDIKKFLNLRYPLIAGSMANGISSLELIREMNRFGMLGFYGAAGLTPAEVESTIWAIKSDTTIDNFGFNLIHSPNEPMLENALSDLYIQHKIDRIEASAYVNLTPAIVKYRLTGIHRTDNGDLFIPHRVIGKVSRVEVARRFASPPPEKMVRELLSSGEITASEAELSQKIPMADALTAEADSGGHTDNRPAFTIFPAIQSVVDSVCSENQYSSPIHVGLAGGIGTPESVAAAFAMGAAYIVTGTINLACRESGTSDTVRQLLSEAQQADVSMAPAADMFETGVNVQVLKRGTMFPMRARKLYEIYTTHKRLEDISPKIRNLLEKQYFKATFDEIWLETVKFFKARDISQVERAQSDPKHQMALVFRWYLGQSSRWANLGIDDRKLDYQIWCGPVMGAFNHWTQSSFLEEVGNRSAPVVSLNILWAAGVLNRMNQLTNQGISIPAELRHVTPQPLEIILSYLPK